jgi:hypothetical protein
VEQPAKSIIENDNQSKNHGFYGRYVSQSNKDFELLRVRIIVLTTQQCTKYPAKTSTWWHTWFHGFVSLNKMNGMK